RLHRSHEQLLILRRADRDRKRTSRLQLRQCRASAIAHLHLQLLLSFRISRWPRRITSAPLPLRLRFLEIRQSVGTGTNKRAWWEKMRIVVMMLMAVLALCASGETQEDIPSTIERLNREYTRMYNAGQLDKILDFFA